MRLCQSTKSASLRAVVVRDVPLALVVMRTVDGCCSNTEPISDEGGGIGSIQSLYSVPVWMPIIEQFHARDINWHYCVEAVMLDPKGDVPSVTAALHEVN